MELTSLTWRRVKSQNGGAMSLGRTASFLDIYIERDFKAGVLNEQQALKRRTKNACNWGQ